MWNHEIRKHEDQWENTGFKIEQFRKEGAELSRETFMWMISEYSLYE